MTHYTQATVEALFALPFHELIFRAQTLHRQHFDADQIQLSSLCSVKTGGCPEDCKYCPQSAHFDIMKGESLLPLDQVVTAVKQAKAAGASRFCMGAAWRSPKGKGFSRMLEMVTAVKANGMEACATLGMLDEDQAQALEQAGLDYYNHNLDSDPSFYTDIITTRSYQDRLDTIGHVRQAGMKLCCGGIVGMGESRAQRAGLLLTLAQLNPAPESVPINRLVAVPGTPLGDTEALDDFEFVRTIAVARLLMPRSVIRLSAGRETMHDSTQALCFLAGANSLFFGDKLLTTANPETSADHDLLQRLGMRRGNPVAISV